MARKREELGGPPTPEELLAYRDNRLDPAARELLEARIAVYPEAARALADLAAFPDIEAGPDARDLSEEEMDAGWQAFRRRLETLPKTVPAPAPQPIRSRAIPWQLAAAAVVLLCTGLLTGYFAGRSSRPAPDAALSASLNPTVAQLEPLDEQESLRAPAAPIELPDESDELLLVLVLPGTREYPAYAAEILDQEGAMLWSGGGLRPTSEGTVRISFRSRAFPPGTYQIHLFGLDGREQAVGTYALRVL